MQIPTVFFLVAPVFNFFSILLPYRFAEGSLKAQRPRAVIVLAALIAMFGTPIVLAPTLLPALAHWLAATWHWDPPVPADVLTALAVLGGATWLYRSVLPIQGRLLQRREQAILREVTAEIE